MVWYCTWFCFGVYVRVLICELLVTLLQVGVAITWFFTFGFTAVKLGILCVVGFVCALTGCLALCLGWWLWFGLGFGF